MSPITTHVLDTAVGRPAAGITVGLEQLQGSDWRTIGQQVTNSDGRCTGLMSEGALSEGIYRIQFATGEYFEKLGKTSFYPQIAIVFRVDAVAEHYHVPVLLSPYGYSTYRGS